MSKIGGLCLGESQGLREKKYEKVKIDEKVYQEVDMNYLTTEDKIKDRRTLREPLFDMMKTEIKETKFLMSDFDFKREFPFNEHNFLTYDYNIFMMKKFGLRYLNELKKQLEKETLKEQNTLEITT